MAQVKAVAAIGAAAARERVAAAAVGLFPLSSVSGHSRGRALIFSSNDG